MATKAPGFTYRDYLCLDDDARHEVLEGELVMVSSPSWDHQETCKRLFRALDAAVESSRLGAVQFAPLDVILSDENVAQPDIVFIAKDRLAIVKGQGVFGPPDLVVEVVSPSKPERDTVVKRRLYGKYGVREYWIVDGDKKTIEVLSVGKAGLETNRVYPIGSVLRSPLIPALEIALSDIFR